MDPDQLLFRIAVLQKEGCVGLLLKTETPAGLPISHAYFYMRDNGLKPTDEMRLSRELNCDTLEGDTDESRLFKLLLAFTEAAHRADDPHLKTVLRDFSDPNTLRLSISHFFEEGREPVCGSPLRASLVSQNTFTDCVLERVRGAATLIGKAAEVRVGSPEDFFPRKSFRYLRSITEVLRIGSSTPACWFRKAGPIAADFYANRVYMRHGKLEALNTLLLRHPAVLLEGVAATGKSVLSRALAYHLYRNGECNVYYCDHNLGQDFDASVAAVEMNSVSGVIILEDLHLIPRQAQNIYSRLRQIPQRHILFTARPSFRAGMHSRAAVLGDIPTLTLEVFEDADAIINHFVVHSRDLGHPMSSREKATIFSTAYPSFWLLAYALKGWATAGDTGKPLDWLVKGVQDDLNDLDLEDPRYPEVLTALSLLYRKEVLTAGSYILKRMGVDVRLLNGLVCRGEITKHTAAEGDVFYGLPHSALAEVYWRHGQEYRRRAGMPEYEDCVYQYAISEMPNALDAIISADDIAGNLTARLDHTGSMRGILARETRIDLIGEWVDIASRSGRVAPDCLPIVAAKIDATTSLGDAAWCVGSIGRATPAIFRDVWASVDEDRLTARLNNTRDMVGVCTFVSNVFKADSKLGSELWARIDHEDLAARLSASQDLGLVGNCLTHIHSGSKEAGEQLVRLLDFRMLAGMFSESFDPAVVADCLKEMSSVDAEVLNTVLERIDYDALARQVVLAPDLAAVGKFLDRLRSLQPKTASRLWTCLDLDGLASRLSRRADLISAGNCLNSLHGYDQSQRRSLAQHLNANAMADVVHASEDVHASSYFVSAVAKLDPEIMGPFSLRLRRHTLAGRLQSTNDLGQLSHAVGLFTDADPSLAKTICDCLDASALAIRLNTEVDLRKVNLLLRTMMDTNESVARRVCEGLDVQAMAKLISRVESVDMLWLVLDVLCSLGASQAHLLCCALDPQLLGRQLSMYASLQQTDLCLSQLSKIDRGVADRICRHLDIDQYAIRFAEERSRTGQMFFIKTIGAINGKIASALCSRIDVQQLARNVKYSGYTDNLYFGYFIATLHRCSESTARDLIRMLGPVELARLWDWSDSEDMTKYIDTVREVDRCVAAEMCNHLDLAWASHVFKSKRPGLARCVLAIERANQSVGRELRQMLTENGE